MTHRRRLPEVIIHEARKRGRRRRLGIGILVVLVLGAAGAVGGVIGNGGSQVHTPVGAGRPHDGATNPAHLYTVRNSTVLTGFRLVTASTRALYALGVRTSLLRVQIDPLAVTARFALPVPALVVIAARGKLWVGTPAGLLAVDPETGAVLHVVPLGFRPAAMAVSPNGRTLYVLGDKQGVATPGAVLSSFNAATGAPLGERTLGSGSSGLGLAATKGGAWVSVMMVTQRTATATIALYKGPSLARGRQIHVGHRGAASRAYVADHVLWLIDEPGTTKIRCASPTTGRIRATGSTGVTRESGTMLTVDGRAFLSLPERLVEIQATSACTS